MNKLLMPETILPGQFGSDATSSTKMYGASALMGAILEDALDCFQKQFLAKDPKVQRLAKEAEEWIFADDRHWTFSFVNICAALGLNPCDVRIRLTQWQANPQYSKWQKKREATPVSVIHE